jgi:L,D-peptidoglycan transpeptidase YkuD (ErfK/YbiS/YcfS/YnhG family)
VKYPSLFINSSTNYININQALNKNFPCRIGIKGYVPAVNGREGDEKTPLGDYKLRFGLYRPDRLPPPKSALTFWPVNRDDGWCDAPNDPAYNRFIRTPYPAKHEVLWREDGAYDIILVISHNDNPPQIDENGMGLGSAVFIHIAQPDDRKTLGCVAVTPDVMTKLLPHLYVGMNVKIHSGN